MFENERREYPRLELKMPIIIRDTYAKLEAKIENVSPNGAFISCKEMPPVDRDFYMVIETPEHKPTSIAARVTWSTLLETEEGNPFYGVGVQFRYMTTYDRQFLTNVISKVYKMKTSRQDEK